MKKRIRPGEFINGVEIKYEPSGKPITYEGEEVIVDYDDNIYYYLNGKLHREHDPAVQLANGKKYYFLNGVELFGDSFYKLTKEEKKEFAVNDFNEKDSEKLSLRDQIIIGIIEFLDDPEPIITKLSIDQKRDKFDVMLDLFTLVRKHKRMISNVYFVEKLTAKINEECHLLRISIAVKNSEK